MLNGWRTKSAVMALLAALLLAWGGAAYAREGALAALNKAILAAREQPAGTVAVTSTLKDAAKISCARYTYRQTVEGIEYRQIEFSTADDPSGRLEKTERTGGTLTYTLGDEPPLRLDELGDAASIEMVNHPFDLFPMEIRPFDENEVESLQTCAIAGGTLYALTRAGKNVSYMNMGLLQLNAPEELFFVDGAGKLTAVCERFTRADEVQELECTRVLWEWLDEEFHA